MFSSNSWKRLNVLNVANLQPIDAQDAKTNGTVREIVKSDNGRDTNNFVISSFQINKKMLRKQKKSKTNRSKVNNRLVHRKKQQLRRKNH